MPRKPKSPLSPSDALLTPGELRERNFEALMDSLPPLPAVPAGFVGFDNGADARLASARATNQWINQNAGLIAAASMSAEPAGPGQARLTCKACRLEKTVSTAHGPSQEDLMCAGRCNSGSGGW